MDVQEALHVKAGTVWEQCSSKVFYQNSDLLRPMMPYYQRLLDTYDVGILVFSGVSTLPPSLPPFFFFFSFSLLFVCACGFCIIVVFFVFGVV